MRVPASPWLVLRSFRRLTDSNWSQLLKNSSEMFVDIQRAVENAKDVNYVFVTNQVRDTVVTVEQYADVLVGILF